MPTEFLDNTRKVGSINSLLKKIHETGKIVWQSGSGRRLDGNHCVAVDDLMLSQEVRSTSQKGTDQLVRFRTKLHFTVHACRR